MRADLASLIFVAVLAIPAFTIAADHSPFSISEDKDRAAKLKEAEEALRGKERALVIGFGAMALQQWRSLALFHASAEKAGGDFGKLAPAAHELREYQSARGLEPTGIMNAITFLRLSDDSDLIRKLELTNAIQLPGMARPLWFEHRGHEFVVVDGTWVITNSDSAYPLQTSKISCDRTEGTCKETIVQFAGSRGGFVSVQETEYTILSWNHDGVRAASSAAQCVDYIIHIQKVEEKVDRPGLVTGHRTVKKGGRAMTGHACEGILEAHLSLRLDAGYEVQERYRQELWKKLGFSPRKEPSRSASSPVPGTD
jgi:hypothetical protein